MSARLPVTARRLLLATLTFVSLAGCAGSASSTSPPVSAAASAGGGGTGGSTGATSAAGDEDVYPVVFIHGIGGEPQDWTHMLDGLEPGRTAFREAYADELAQLAPGSVPR